MRQGETREWGDGGFGAGSLVGWVSRKRNPLSSVWDEGRRSVSLRSPHSMLATRTSVMELLTPLEITKESRIKCNVVSEIVKIRYVPKNCSKQPVFFMI